jgi:cell division inhibitor SepF
MQQNRTEADEYEDSPHRGDSGLFGWLKDSFRRTRIDEDEDYLEDEEEAAPRPSTTTGAQSSNISGVSIPSRRNHPTPAYRIDSSRRSKVTVRRSVHSFEDVRRAVDELREGVQQVINLEQTPVDMSERLIDFLNGATYALDGCVEKIGEHVFLFTPSSVQIEVEDNRISELRPAFFDKE